MKLVEKMRASKKDEGPRTFTFNLTMSHLLSASVVAVLGLCWVFILGVLVGRGYKPENTVPEIAKIMPTTQAPKEEQPVSNQTLRPDELHYQDSLIGKAKAPDPLSAEPVKSPWTEAAPVKADPAQLKAAAAAQKAKDAKDAKGKDAKAKGKDGKDAKDAKGKDAKPEEQKTKPGQVQQVAAQAGKDKAKDPVGAALKEAKDQKADAKAKDGKPAEAKPKDGKPAEAKPKDGKPAEAKAPQADGKGRFAASYQLSSYDNAEAAKAASEKIAKSGLKARVEEIPSSNGVKKYRIVTTLTGTEEEIRAALEKSGSKGAILRSKKPL